MSRSSQSPHEGETSSPTLRRTLSDSEAAAWEDELRGRLGLLPRGLTLPSQIRLRGWIVTTITTLIAALTRLWNLAHPHALIFDETYYVKGATSLLTQGFEGKWGGESVNAHFLRGDVSALSATDADYVVHPPLGKWLMAAGQAIFGTDNGVGWRISTALAGIACVFLVARIAMRMFRSPVVAALASGALALDGMGIVLSRTGILDNLLSCAVLLAFYILLLDRENMRARLARSSAREKIFFEGGTTGSTSGESCSGSSRSGESCSGEFCTSVFVTPAALGGPALWWRPWLALAGLILGLACGIKWSALYAIAVFGIMVFIWGMCARRAVGIRCWKLSGFVYDGILAFYAFLVPAFLGYLASWLSWFLNPHSYGRSWAHERIAAGLDLPLPWASKSLNSLLHYHDSMWTFHNGLSSPHNYMSQAWQWIFQLRPVSFYWRGTDAMAETCPGEKCVQAITSIGNPAVWFIALLGLAVVIWAALRERDWRAWAILAGYGAMWVPWLSYTNRTIFQFYAVAFLPYVVLAFAFGLSYILGLLCPARMPARSFTEVCGSKAKLLYTDDETAAQSSSVSGVSVASGVSPVSGVSVSSTHSLSVQVTEKPTITHFLPQGLERAQVLALMAVAGFVVITAIFWFPLWTGGTVSYTFWHMHMWLHSWI